MIILSFGIPSCLVALSSGNEITVVFPNPLNKTVTPENAVKLEGEL
jgi:hypothetical protein